MVLGEVPAAGTQVKKVCDAAVVESVKAASDIYAPVSGEVTEGNAALEADPSLINSDPEGEGWFFKLTLSDNHELSDLMSAEDYKTFCDSLRPSTSPPARLQATLPAMPDRKHRVLGKNGYVTVELGV